LSIEYSGQRAGSSFEVILRPLSTSSNPAYAKVEFWGSPPAPGGTRGILARRGGRCRSECWVSIFIRDLVVALAGNVIQMVSQFRVDLRQQDAQSVGNSCHAEPLAGLWPAPFQAVALEAGGALNG